jgi:hypothetical protein
MSENKPKPPTNYRALSAITTRNLVIGFIVIVFVIGTALIATFYGGGAVFGALSCFFLAFGLVGVVALVLVGLGKFSEWLDKQ